MLFTLGKTCCAKIRHVLKIGAALSVVPQRFIPSSADKSTDHSESHCARFRESSLSKNVSATRGTLVSRCVQPVQIKTKYDPPAGGVTGAEDCPAKPQGALVNKRLLRPFEVEAEYGLPTGELAKKRGAGGSDAPPFLRFGRAIYYDRQDLERWIANSKRNSTSDPGRGKDLLSQGGVDDR